MSDFTAFWKEAYAHARRALLGEPEPPPTPPEEALTKERLK